MKHISAGGLYTVVVYGALTIRPVLLFQSWRVMNRIDAYAGMKNYSRHIMITAHRYGRLQPSGGCDGKEINQGR